jgi:hypothetical protein
MAVVPASRGFVSFQLQYRRGAFPLAEDFGTLEDAVRRAHAVMEINANHDIRITEDGVTVSALAISQCQKGMPGKGLAPPGK